jgi:hypothetical protein
MLRFLNDRPVGRTSLLRIAYGVLGLAVASAPGSLAQTTPAPGADDRFVVEYYYKARWGYDQEFITLFRRNHLPILEKEIEKGRILEVSIVRPRYHGTEEGRWDYRVTIVYPTVAAAHAVSPVTPVELRRLFPDSAAFAREEQRRFEILEAHWDLPVVPAPLRP